MSGISGMSGKSGMTRKLRRESHGVLGSIYVLDGAELPCDVKRMISILWVVAGR